MSLAPKLAPRMSVTEFLTHSGDGTGRIAELVDGLVRLQDPGSVAHGTVQTNLTALISSHLRATRPGCKIVANPGIEPRVRADWNFRVPELGVNCMPDRPGQKMLPEPVLLIEVLSPSNAADTWSNVPLYASVPSVMEILLVESTEIAGHLLRRGADGSWPKNPEPIGPTETVRLASIGLEVPLADIYRDTHLG